jgi:hypothetical protein
MRTTLFIAAAVFAAAIPAAAQERAFPVRLSAEPSARDMSDALIEAFRLPAASRGVEARRAIDDAVHVFRPVALHRIGADLWVLLSTGSKEDAGHVDEGVNAIHYLRDAEGGWQLVGEWLNLGSVGTVGNAATAWGFTTALGNNPYLVTSGGGVWQGCAVSLATLTELTPGGPVDRGSFTDAMSSGAGPGQKNQAYDGAIVAAERDKSFTVAYTGTRAFRQRYVLNQGRYKLVGKDRVPGC